MDVHGAGIGDVPWLSLLPALAGGEVIRVRPLDRVFARTLVRVGGGAARTIVPFTCQPLSQDTPSIQLTELVVVTVVVAFAVGSVATLGHMEVGRLFDGCSEDADSSRSSYKGSGEGDHDDNDA